MLADLGTHLIKTLQQHGRVLIPCQPCGLVFDLLECVYNNLNQDPNLVDVPIIFVSPVAKSCTEYAERTAEWLCTSRQEQVCMDHIFHSRFIALSILLDMGGQSTIYALSASPRSAPAHLFGD